ncbi:MAG: quinol:electron acceptor oxidoreductase subunit ActD, partial [Gemmatimonadaceae bacterium]
MRDGHWPAGAYAAEFADERQFAGALAVLRDQGYTKLETYTPYPVARTAEALPARPSVLPPVVFFA